MTFQPIIPSAGLNGWRFLQRTLPNQADAFQNGPVIQRDLEYFKETISKIDSAKDLVADRRLLGVALGAFGLQDDINNRYFIQKILEEGVIRPDSLANRLADDRYKSMTKAFGFGDFTTPNTKLSTFANDISSKFLAQEFEAAVGQQDNSLRLALNAKRSLPEIATSSDSNDTNWFRIMGNPPLRTVFEKALGLPSSFSQLDLDKQLNTFKERSQKEFGSDEISQFVSSRKADALIQKYIVRQQVADSTGYNSNSVALTLIQSIPRMKSLYL